MNDIGPFADLDGVLTPTREIPAADDEDSFFRGHGLFETVLAESGVLPFAALHFARLRGSAHQLGLPEPPADAVLTARIRAVLKSNHLLHSTARVRLRLDLRGVLVLASAAGEDLPRQREAGVSVTTLGPGYASGADPGHKTTDRPSLRAATRIARERGAAEALLLDGNERLLEGATSNVFCVEDGELFTPPLRAGILPGVTRSLVLSIAIDAGLCVHEVAPDLERLNRADEVFLTSAIRILLPVVRIDEAVIGSGKPGPVSRVIASALARRISNAAG
jgi:branched-subunit amino acid aminotransferase/4-amino-4-deoxychorismate lyase